MLKKTPSATALPKFNQPLNLFWRLFLSMLAILLLTSALSVGIERWINSKELNNKMQLQVTRLLETREQVIAALQQDDLRKVRHLYREDRWLMSQIRIVNENSEIIFPKYDRYRTQSERRVRKHSEPNSNFGSSGPHIPPKPGLPPPISDSLLQQVSFDSSNYPQLKDTSLTSNSGKTYTIQLQPRLSLPELMSLRKDHSLIRVMLILLFSILVCYWLSRALTGRIQRVQQAVHSMSEGRFSAGEDLKYLGSDELGMLAKDVSELATRLAESELARKQMLSDISHELRSPLARLEVATELTRDFAPEAGSYLDRIEKESGRMNQLIEHIIQIQSLQMRRHALDIEAFQRVNLYMLIKEIEEDVCFEFQEKHISWQWQCLNNAGTPMAHPLSAKASDSILNIEAYELMGDPDHLHSAFENIIRNAFTHTANDSTVTVVLQPFIHPDKQLLHLKVQVIDQGSGVAEKDLQRIFQPFVRLSSSRERLNQAPKKQYSGYGLGLAIAHAVIVAHQGQLIAYNRQDGLSGLVVEAMLPTHFKTINSIR